MAARALLDDNLEYQDLVEFLGRFEAERIPRRYIRDAGNPIDMYNNEQFKMRYRFSKETVS